MSSATRTRDGSIVLSREKARREEAWTNLEKAFEAQQRVNGTIYGRVKGGFTVDLGGAVAFLPGSQVDIRPVRDVGPLMGTPQPFQILKMDRARGNIVVSRRAVLEETRAEQRSELIQGLKEGQILDGVVKNITDYGAFVDLGGVDGLLHVTDIAWRRINHPSEALADRPAGQGAGHPLQLRHPAHQPRHEAARGRSVGRRRRQVPAGRQVHRPRHQHHRLRRLRGAGAGGRGPGARLRNVLDQEERPSRQDRLHLARKSTSWCWTSTAAKRRISLGLKQVQRNPWEQFVDEHPIGSVVEGEIRNITEFGLFIGLSRGHRRHGAHVRPVLGRARRSGDGQVREGPDRQGQGARRRCREGAHLASASSSLRDDPAAARARPRAQGRRSSPAWSPRCSPTASR